MIAKVLEFFSLVQLKIARANLVVKRPEFGQIDYSFYLGKNFKSLYTPPTGKVPTYIAPHCSALDGPCMISALHGKLSAVAKDSIANWPCFGFIVNALKCIFVPRGSSPAVLEQTLHMIEQRQKVIEETGAYNPLIIFPEGCCTNNTALLPFKRGAFYGLNQCHPVSIKYTGCNVKPSISVLVEDLAVFVYFCHWRQITAEVIIMPPF